jgi:hypothetical protein
VGLRGASAGAGAAARAALALLAGCGSGPDAATDACPDCAIRLEYVATIGEGTGEGALDEQLQFVARDDRGRFIVTSNVEALPFLYDSSGTYLGRLGSEGEGPGQFTSASAVHSVADSLYVLDRGQGRILVFDGELSFVRTISGLAPYYAAVSLPGGLLMANNSRPTGPPLTVYDAEGEIVATAGDTVVADPVFAHLHQPRRIASSSSGGAWAVKSFFMPVVREWDAAGKLLREFALDVDWYEPYETIRNPGPETPPSPRVTGIWEDQEGRVWITGTAADERWAAGLGESRRGEGGIEYYPIDDIARTLDAYVSVLDAETGQVLHQRRFDRVFLGIDPTLVIEPRPDDLGFQPLLVHRLTLVTDP